MKIRLLSNKLISLFTNRTPTTINPTNFNHNRNRFRLIRKMHSASSKQKPPYRGTSTDSKGNPFLVPGATVATILMLGALYARRMYHDRKIEEARENGIELELQPDVKAKFLNMLPLRSISRFWGSLTGTELPVWLRPYAQSLGSCLPFNPVDGTVMRVGELKEGVLIEQVKGFSYSVSSLLGLGFLPLMAAKDVHEDSSIQENDLRDESTKSWWRISLASPKLRESSSARPMKGLFYCVIYLGPGDYHHIHSPVDWNVILRRHFSGRLYPVNERATRTIKNLYVENERVVLEGRWQEGYIAMAAIGATNIGSIELFIEPELRTNQPRKKLLQSEAPEEQVYEPEGTGVSLKKGDEVGVFNMGSTVVLVFQAPALKKQEDQASSSEFRFCVEKGGRIRVGEALGQWHDL